MQKFTKHRKDNWHCNNKLDKCGQKKLYLIQTLKKKLYKGKETIVFKMDQKKIPR